MKMGSNQHLILKNKLNNFSTIWVAGNTNRFLKNYQRFDVETVNVTATCDELKLTLATQSPENFENRIESAVGEKSLPFRIMCKLCYGTLRVYQQQVNHLLSLSKDLASRSTLGLVLDTFKPTKRKTSSSEFAIAHSAAKKSCLESLTITQSKTNSISNYNDLLRECEYLNKWSQEQSLYCEQSEFIDSTNGIETESFKLNHLFIRDVDVLECEADVKIPELDDEIGFGNENTQELAEFIAFLKDATRNCLKRKAPPLTPVPNKKLKILDESNSIEVVRCRSQNSFPIESYFEISYVNGKSRISNKHTMQNSTQLIEKNFEKNGLQLALIEDNPLKNIVESSFDMSINNSKDIATTSEKSKKPRLRKTLIIDKRTRMDETLIRAQILRHNKFSGRLPQLPQKKMTTAQELMKSLNRRCRTKFDFKRKVKPQTECVKLEFLNILRNILDSYTLNEELISLVNPKWDPQKERHRKRNKQRQQIVFDDKLRYTEFGGNNNVQVADIILPNGENYITTPVTPRDCSPHGVMMKLLDFWHNFPQDEIDANRLCLTAGTRLGAAVIFSSLMSLAADKYITITKNFGTLKMGNIKLASASKKLIKHTFQQKGKI